MKQIKLWMALNEKNEAIGTKLATRGFTNELEKILIITGLLENLKQEQLKKLDTMQKEARE